MLIYPTTGRTEQVLWAEWMVAFVAGPLCGVMARRSWYRLGRSWQVGLLAVGSASTALAFLTLFTPWSLRGFWTDAINLGLAYVSLSAALWLSLKKLPRWISLPVPILANALFVPVGLIGLAFSSDEIPYREVEIGRGLIAQTYLRGFAGNDFDQIHVVYRHPWLPFVEKTIYDRSISIDECGEPDPPARLASNPRTLEIICGSGVQDNVAMP